MAKRAKQAILGFLTDTGGQAVIQIATLVAIPIIIQLTSQTLYGFWLTAISILAYLGLLDLGLGVSMMRLLAGIYGKSDNKEEFNRILSTGFFSFCAAGVVFLCAGFAMAPYVPGWFKIPVTESAVVITAYKLAILAGAIGLPMSTFGATVVATQHMAVNNTIRNVVTLLSLGLTIGLLYAGLGLPSLALANLFNFSTGGIANYFFACRYCPGMKIRPFLINRKDFIRLWTFGGYLQVVRVSSIVATSAAPIIIASYLGAANVIPYNLTSKLASLFAASFASKLGIAVFPALSQMFANHEEENVRRVFITLIHYSVRLAIVGGIFLAIANRHFVTLWVGEEMFGGMFLNAVFVYWVFQDSILRSIGVVVHATGKLRGWTFMAIIEVVITIGASILLVKPLGLSGIALGMCISRTITTIYLVLWLCRELDLPVGVFVLKGILLPFSCSFPGCIIVIIFVFATVGGSHGWFWLFAVGLISFGLNIISFEGVRFFSMSELTWLERVKQMFRQPWGTFCE